MRIWLVGLLAFMVYAQPANIDDVANQAAAAYAQGDYATAVQLYEVLVGQGVQDGNLYFNLGNAYLQTGNLGSALLNYRRAQLFIPRDTDLNLAIAQIQAERIDVQGDDVDFVAQLSALSSGFLTQNELIGLVGLLWALWGGLFTVFLVSGNWLDGRDANTTSERLSRIREQRRWLYWAVIGLGIGVVMGIGLLAARLVDESNRPDAVITADSVSAMSGPGDDYLELYTLHAAAEVYVVERRNGWMWFAMPDGQQGWIPESSVEAVRPS